MNENEGQPAMEFNDPLSDYETTAYDGVVDRALAEESIGSIDARPFSRLAPTATVGMPFACCKKPESEAF